MPLRRIVLRILAIAVVFFVAATLRLGAIALLPIDYDEDDYLRAGQQYATAIQQGDWAAFTLENYRSEHPPLSKIAYGVALAALPPAPEIPDRATTAEPAASLPQPHLTVARLVAGGFGLLEVLALAVLSPLAGLLLAVHSWTIKYTSQVMLEALPSLTSLLSVLFYVAYRRSGRRDRFWIVLSAISLGLTAAAKYPYCLAGVAVAADWLWATRPETLRAPGALRRWLLPVLGWSALAVIVFFVADPYLWPDPVGRLWSSLTYHAGYAQSEGVTSAGYPPWQPLVWLALSVPWHPGVIVVTLDLFIALFAIAGFRRAWGRERVLGLWFLIVLVYLLAWPTKWPQYVLLLSAPLAFIAAEGILATVWEPLVGRVVGWRRSLAAWLPFAAGIARVPGVASVDRAAHDMPDGGGTHPARPRRSSWRRTARDTLTAAPWLLPGTLALGLIVAFPLLYQLAMSLTDFTALSIRDGMSGGVLRETWLGITGQVPAVPYDPFSGATSTTVSYAGPHLLSAVLFSEAGVSLFVASFVWTVLVVSCQVALGVGVAVLLRRRGVRFVAFWSVLFILPWAIPEFVGAVAWRNIFDPAHGWLVLATGHGLDWSSPAQALLVALIAGTWAGWPLVFLAATAGLILIPADVYDAAAIDGAGAWPRFRSVTWPMLVPILAPVIVIRVIFAFNQFYLLYVFAVASNGRFPLSTVALTSFFLFDPTSGGGLFALSAAVNIVTVVVLVVLVLWLTRWQRGTEGAAYA